MNIKIKALSSILIIAILISFGLGFLVGYSKCSFKTYAILLPKMNADELFIESKKFIPISDINGIIDAIEKNGDFKALLVKGFYENVSNIYMKEETKKEYSQSLEAWNEAKKNLEDIRIKYTTQKDPNR
jgi:hypothetical protein